MEKHDDLSGCELVSCGLVVVLDVTDVLVSPSSVVTEFCDGSSLCADREFVEPQSFSFSILRAHCCTDTQEEMRYEGSPVKAPPITRRRMTPPAPMQNSCTSFEGAGKVRRGRQMMECERTKQFLGRSFSVKVRVEELERFAGTRRC